MLKREAKFTTEKLMPFFKSKKSEEHFPKGTYAIEVKVCKGHRLPLEAVVPHQKRNLQTWADRERVFVWKLPDAGFQNPFDIFMSRGESRGKIIVAFTLKATKIYIIDIYFWNSLCKNLDKPSITESDLAKIVRPVSLQ